MEILKPVKRLSSILNCHEFQLVDIDIIQVNKGFSPSIYLPGSFSNIGL